MTADAVGGVWSYAVDLARALSGRGVTTLLAVMGPPPGPAQRADALAIPGLTLQLGDYRLEWMPEPWQEVAAAGAWLARLAEDFAADLVHLNGYAHAAIDFGRPVLVVAHSCVVSWWEAVRGAPAPPEWSRYREAVSRSLAEADAVVAPSAAMARSLARHYGGPQALVIPNGIDLAAIRPGPKQDLILAAGRVWDEAKNLSLLDRIAPPLPWPICVAGDGRHPSGGIAGAEQVRLLGILPRPALLAEMARAAIYALPARYEPFGLSILEAAACGCALVLGDIASLREHWECAAVFVDPSDAAAWRQALIALIGDPERRAGLGDAARERARAFSIERTGERYLALYDTLCRDCGRTSWREAV